MKENDLDLWIDESLPKFELLGKHIAFIVENLLQQNKIEYLSVSYRTKTKEGIFEKVGRKKYKNPTEELTDISGVRIILYLESDILKVSDIIKSTFNIDIKNSMDNEGRLSSDRIGYRSVHYVCDIGEKRNALKEYEFISGLNCEIQVRTMLQHAWAELTHDRNYKLGANLPLQIQRKINLFSGMLEIADEGFSEIVNSIEEYKESIKNDDINQLSSQEINSINLFKFVQEISREIGLKLYPVKDWGGTTTKDIIDELEFTGLNDFKALAEAIPENYAEVCNELITDNNIYGFLRDLMLIKDFEKLSNKEALNWALVGDVDDIEADKMREFYSHFMSQEKASQMVHTFAAMNQ
ncbi:GTP pyrophosphokinase [Enterobacter cloacae]|uniref:GTP pyrophosphokinase n=1 Tax=Enterobacter cloacae TaxID=550 RepID=UPI0021D145A9|nr:GTP pyrophosphokinase [Enterobacter cloacae]MCU6411375.1 GTP pyrophosphokinase [Enterobacter cloacae]MEA5214885.1 GTP pyrophosphokinase [Enterobacter cloacae]